MQAKWERKSAGLLRLVVLRDDFAQLQHQTLRLRRTAVCDNRDRVPERFRGAGRFAVEVIVDDAAVEKRGKRRFENIGNQRKHFQRNWTVAALESAKMKLGYFQKFCNVLLSQVQVHACGADVAPDRFKGNQHSHSP